MNLEKLFNEEWEEAIVIFEQSNFTQSFSRKGRSYKISSRNKYFKHDKVGTSLFGDCLDGTDNGVRLDLYRWKVEDIEVIK